MVKKATLAIVALSIVAILGWGFWLAFLIETGVQETVSPRKDMLKFYHEICSATVDGFGNCLVAFAPVTLPQRFSMSSIILDDNEGRGVITLRTHYFGAELNPGTRIVFSINATEPSVSSLSLIIERMPTFTTCLTRLPTSVGSSSTHQRSILLS